MKIIAHRGASGYRPENTLASFAKALELRVDMIELDVHVLKTGELVVIHDDTVDRTTDGTGHVSEFGLEQLRQLDAGHGQRIPLLTEVLELIDRKLPVNIELKGKGTAAPVAALIRDYTEHKDWSKGLFMVSSFDRHELQVFMRLLPSIRVGALFEGEPKHYASLARHNSAFSANMNSVFVTNKNVYKAHKRGLKVYAYTVNDIAEAERMEELQVDGIFSDFPDKIAAQLSRV
jgi:glycerophosphoryl diester phosphodiesterase